MSKTITKIILFSLHLALWTAVSAQDTCVLDQEGLWGNDARHCMVFLMDSAKVLDFSDMPRPEFQPLPVKMKKVINQHFWVRLHIRNELNRDTALIFSCPNQDFIDLYVLDGSLIHPIGLTGKFYPRSKRSLQDMNSISVPLPANSTHTFFVRILNYGLSCDAPMPLLMNTIDYQYFLKGSSIGRSAGLPLLIFFLGLLSMVTAISLVYFLIRRDSAYLWYAIYTGFLLAHVAVNEEMIDLSDWPVFNHTASGYRYFSAFLILAYISFVQFIRKFCHLPTEYPRANKWGTVVVLALILILLYHIFYFFGTGNIFYTLQSSSIISYTSFIVGIYGVVAMWEMKQGGARLLFYGMFGFLMLSGVGYGIARALIYVYDWNLWIRPNDLYAAGLLFQMLYFSAALARKSKEDEAEKLAAQESALKAQLMVASERTRIAFDLHDDLGSGLSAIQFMINQQKNTEQTPAQRKNLISIQHRADRLVDSMRDIIWAMDCQNDSLEALVSYMRTYANDYLGNCGLESNFVISSGLPNQQIGGMRRRNIVLVVKEALHNIVKHAQAKQVAIYVLYEENILSINIQDDGKGLPPSFKGGNGFRSMNARIQEIQGTCKWVNSGTGLRIEIKADLTTNHPSVTT